MLKKNVSIYIFIVYLFLFTAIIDHAIASDWQQWRGPNRDGISTESIKVWENNDPKIVWRVPIGEGFSAISISNDRGYTMDTDGTDEFVICFDAKNGDQIWRVRSGKFYRDTQGGHGPRATPTIDDGRLFTVSGHGTLHALDIENGDQIWSVDLKTEFGSATPRWGFCTSPIIDGDRVLIEVGGKGDNSIMIGDE